MPRFTRSLFTDLTFWMVGLGVLTGVAFPVVTLALGVDPDRALTIEFFVACMAAGTVVGLCSGWLARRVVRPRLALLARGMRRVEDGVRQATWTGDWSDCRPEDCVVSVDSEDELGESALAFNELVVALRRSHDVQAALAHFSRSLTPEAALATTAAEGLDLLLEYAPAEAGLVFVQREGTLEALAVTGLADADAVRRSAPVQRALRTGRLVCLSVEDEEPAPAKAVEAPPDRGGPEGSGVRDDRDDRDVRDIRDVRDVRIQGVTGTVRAREVAVLPLTVQDEVVGAVVLAAREPFTAESTWLLDLFRGVLALSLKTALAYERLERLAALDSLTRAYCRRFGLARLREEFHRARREGALLGLLLLDLDHFKGVNDTYGHLVGDRVLERVAGAIRGALRDGDVVIRYGGEEFLVVLPGATPTDAYDVAERLRAAVRDAAFLDGGHLVGVTVSIGAVSYPANPASDEHQLIRDADRAMYAAKQAGRDRVVLAEPAPRPEPAIVRPLRA